MKKPAFSLAAVLSAALLAASAAGSVLLLAGARRLREQSLLLDRRLRELAAAMPASPASWAPGLPAPSAPPASAPAAQPPAALPPAVHPPETIPPPEAQPAHACSSPTQPQTAGTRPPPAHAQTAGTRPPPEADLPLQGQLADGLRCFAQGRYQEAASRFASVLAMQPENLQARRCYAISLYRTNPGDSQRRAEISRRLRQVLREQPQDAEALELLGRICVEEEDWSEALGLFRLALELRPENRECLRLAGSCALYGGELEEAEGFFLRECRLQGAPAESWHLLGLARERSGRLEQALDGYLRCLELDPGHPQARLRAGLALLKLGSFQQAREQLQRQVGGRPCVEGLTALGDCFQALGEPAKAEALWRRALQRCIPATAPEKRAAAELYLRLSRAAWQRQAAAQSLTLAEQGLRCEALPLLRTLQGMGYLATGRPSRGRALLQAVLAEMPGGEASSLAEQALGELRQ